MIKRKFIIFNGKVLGDHKGCIHDFGCGCEVDQGSSCGVVDTRDDRSVEGKLVGKPDVEPDNELHMVMDKALGKEQRMVREQEHMESHKVPERKVQEHKELGH